MEFLSVDEAKERDRRDAAELAAAALNSCRVPVWLQTYSGRMVDLGNPQSEQIDIVDIAHHLALLNRFTGATREPYSVAEHSLRVYVVVSDMTGDWNVRLAALLHDAAEAYWGDDSKPKRELLGDGGEQHLLRVIFAKYGLPWEWAEQLPEQVQTADLGLLEKESRELLWGGRRSKWNRLQELQERPPICPKPWQAAEREFLDQFQLVQRFRQA